MTWLYLYIFINAMFVHLYNAGSRSSNWPHGGVQSDAFRVVQLLIQEGHTCLPIFVAHEDPVIHVIHEVEVSGEPVDGHLLHIWTETGEEGWGLRYRDRQSVFSTQMDPFRLKWTWVSDDAVQTCISYRLSRKRDELNRTETLCSTMPAALSYPHTCSFSRLFFLSWQTSWQRTPINKCLCYVSVVQSLTDRHSMRQAVCCLEEGGRCSKAMTVVQIFSAFIFPRCRAQGCPAPQPDEENWTLGIQNTSPAHTSFTFTSRRMSTEARRQERL